MSYVRTVVAGEPLLIGTAVVRAYHDGPRLKLVVDAPAEVSIETQDQLHAGLAAGKEYPDAVATILALHKTTTRRKRFNV